MDTEETVVGSSGGTGTNPEFVGETPVLLAPETEKRAPKRPRKESIPKEKTMMGRKTKTAPAPSSSAQEGVEEIPTGGDAGNVEESRGGVLVVHKAVRMTLKSMPTPYHVSADFMSALNTRVHELLMDATNRAAANGRKTLRSSDL
jgi:hypothetical protein